MTPENQQTGNAGKQPENEPCNPPAATDTSPQSEDGEENRPQREHGGPKGLEPTRYGDWERNGRCSDF